MAVARPVICRKRDGNDVARHDLVLDDPRADHDLAEADDRDLPQIDDRAAKLAAIPAGQRAANRGVPVAVVVISSNGEEDRSVESLEVKVPGGWGSIPV